MIEGLKAYDHLDLARVIYVWAVENRQGFDPGVGNGFPPTDEDIGLILDHGFVFP